MSALPESITALMTELNRLPGIGPRSAERIALHLVQGDPAAVHQLADAIARARDRVRFLEVGGAL
jgi:recombination protein RecR